MSCWEKASKLLDRRGTEGVLRLEVPLRPVEAWGCFQPLTCEPSGWRWLWASGSHCISWEKDRTQPSDQQLCAATGRLRGLSALEMEAAHLVMKITLLTLVNRGILFDTAS